MRKILVMAQFALTIIIMVGSVVIYKQLNYIRFRNLGFNSDHILCVRMRGGISRQYEAVQAELLKHSHILAVAPTANLPIQLQSGTFSSEWEGKTPGENVQMQILWVDHNYLKTFELEMAEGRFFSKDISTDRTEGFVLNETAVKAMGIESPVGKRFSPRGQDGKIIGVVKDFNYRSVHSEIEPLILINRPQRFYNFCIKIIFFWMFV